MSEPKPRFTPGPWNVIEMDTGWIVGPREIDSEDYIADVGEVHKHITNTEYEREKANAYLIAAAPALYEACASMLETCGGSEYWNGETEKSLILIESALARARGETEEPS